MNDVVKMFIFFPFQFAYIVNFFFFFTALVKFPAGTKLISWAVTVFFYTQKMLI